MPGTLFAHRSQLVTRTDLMTIPAPAGTATWRPVAHGELLRVIDQELAQRGVGIQRERFAIQRDGARLFGVLDLAYEATEEFTAAMGIRTSNDRRLALEIAVGVKVFVCDNLAFSGDLIALHRKHTAKFDLDSEIARALGRYEAQLPRLKQTIYHLQEIKLPDSEAKGLICDAFREEILPLRYFKRVAETYFRPAVEMTDVAPRARWGLLNAFTRVVREMAPAPAFKATVALGKFFGLTRNGG